MADGPGPRPPAAPHPAPPRGLAAEDRRARLRDAARLLPALGAALLLAPILWPGGAEGPGNAAALLYLFGAWACLILAAALLARALLRDRAGEEGGGGDA